MPTTVGFLIYEQERFHEIFFLTSGPGLCVCTGRMNALPPAAVSALANAEVRVTDRTSLPGV